MEEAMTTRKLAQLCVDTTFDDIPAAVIDHAKKSILNWYGVGIGASGHPSMDMLLDVAAAVAPGGNHAVLGRSERTDMLNAVLVNGMSSHIFDFDDTHLETIHHPSGPVAPVCIALAEKYDLSGQDVFRAFILGCEAELRIACAVCPGHYDLGWHVTSSTGVFGAAVAAGVLLGLDEDQLTHALGVAGTQSLGFRDVFGTMTKPFHPGRAASVGLHAALLAQWGFTSSTRILEAPRGFCHVTSPEPDLARITGAWGASWELLKNTFKPYACGIVLHPSIDAGSALGDLEGRDPGRVEEIEVRVNKYVLELTGKPTPSVGLEGKFSIYHAVAVAYLTGVGGEAQFSDEAVVAPDVLALRERVRPVVDESVPEHAAVAQMRTSDGEKRSAVIDHATGSLQNPMTPEMLEAKFRSVVSPVLGEERIPGLLDQLWSLDDAPDLRSLLELSVRGVGAPR